MSNKIVKSIIVAFALAASISSPARAFPLESQEWYMSEKGTCLSRAMVASLKQASREQGVPYPTVVMWHGMTPTDCARKEGCNLSHYYQVMGNAMELMNWRKNQCRINGQDEQCVLDGRCR